MKKQLLFLSATIFTGMFINHIAVARADQVTNKENVNVTTALMNEAHNAGHPFTTKDQPFWSKEQSKQAKLEVKYNKEISENPDNKHTYAYLAALYLTNNKTVKAIDAYQDAITHNPENPKLFAAISIAYLHQSKFAMAKAMADEALRLDPSLVQVEKINEYIVAKEAAIQAASNIPLENTDKQGSIAGPAPTDAIHGAKGSTLQIDSPLDWTKQIN